MSDVQTLELDLVTPPDDPTPRVSPFARAMPVDPLHIERSKAWSALCCWFRAIAKTAPLDGTRATSGKTAAKPTIHAAVPSRMEPRIRSDHVTSVRWLWSHVWGEAKGYQLFKATPGPILTALTPLVTERLPRGLIGQSDSVAVDWLVSWRYENGAQVIIKVEVNVGQPTVVANPASDKLSEVFPRDADNQPLQDKSVEGDALLVLPWGDDSHLRDVFFGRYEKEVWSKRACPRDRAEAFRKEVLVREYGRESLKGFNGDVDELLAKLAERVEKDYPLAMALFDEKASSRPAAASNAQSEPTPPVEPNVGQTLPPSDYAKGKQSTPGNGLGLGGLVQGNQAVADKPLTAPLPESPIVVYPKSDGNVHYKGVKFSVTLRLGGSIAMALPYMEDFVQAHQVGLIEIAPNCLVAPAQSAPQPIASDSGKAACLMVKVGRTFKNDKDQLSFECSGFEDPLKYSAKETGAFLKITSGLRKADGSPITAADLAQGAKLAVGGKVLWKKSEDGKYINVIGTEAA